jgi:hypothetical protein
LSSRCPHSSLPARPPLPSPHRQLGEDEEAYTGVLNDVANNCVWREAMFKAIGNATTEVRA